MARLILMNKISRLKASKEVKIEGRIRMEGGKHDNEFDIGSSIIIFS